MDRTEFFGSQVGGARVVNYGYTDMPWRLLGWDLLTFFVYIRFMPYILWPMRPTESAEYDELSWTFSNNWCIFLHAVLVLLQLAFFVALPFAALLPAWLFGAVVGAFLLANYVFCFLLNGFKTKFESDKSLVSEEERLKHRHEKWIFLNGVAVGHHWMQNNIDRLALTFGRDVLGIHNKTNGILFDVLECLVQRNLSYATYDVRMGYSILKETLYDPALSKVVFICHSQGGIEGSLVLDWLLQELPQDLLAKLEVYTFGCAANHFNNPHRHVISQKLAQGPDPLATVTQTTSALSAGSDPDAGTASPPAESANAAAKPAVASLGHQASTLTETTSTRTAAYDRAIGHMEHYAHTTDFVARWGVLHFVVSPSASTRGGAATHTAPRFMGRVFSRTSPRGGHQFCQHYLDGMFPLERDTSRPGGLRCRDSNPFMDSEVANGSGGGDGAASGGGDEKGKSGKQPQEVFDSERLSKTESAEPKVSINLREGLGISWFGASGATAGVPIEVQAAVTGDVGNHSERRTTKRTRESTGLSAEAAGKTTGGVYGSDTVYRVKDLSRLWQYRNGMSPEEIPPHLYRDPMGVIRGATM